MYFDGKLIYNFWVMKFLFFISIVIVGYSCAHKSSNSELAQLQLENSLSEIPESEVDFGTTYKDKTFFIDKTKEYGLGDISATNFNMVDIDKDGFTDLVMIPEYYAQPLFYRFNIHTNKFELMDSPFEDSIKASFILFYDLNRDDILDAVVGVINQKSELIQHPIRIFKGTLSQGKLLLQEDKKAIEAEAAPTATVSLVDYDLDGDLDLFIGNWLKKEGRSVIPHRDTLLINENGRYTERTELLTGELKQNQDKLMYIEATPTYGSLICDIDQNGFPDILTAASNGYRNRLWMNRYKVRDKYRYFEDFGIESLFGGDTEGNLTSMGGGRTFALACTDYNNDGIMDVYLGEVAHSYDNELKDKSSILTGSTFKFPPFFYRTEYFYETEDLEWHQSDKRAIWFDYNNDGLIDLLVENSGYPPHTRLILFKQLPDHSFENVSKEMGIDLVNPLSTVIADVNRDGKWDIITAQSNIRDARIKKRIYLFENNMDLSHKTSVKFYLRGQKSNFHGLNATISLKVKKAQGYEIRTQNVVYSYGGIPPQNEEGMMFALNEGESIDYVKVTWPYTKSLNQNRAGLEKVYHIKKEYLKAINFTLCENGDYLVGRLPCP